ncbi:hypothetical protein M9458_026186, partial [Cirrhinus mrigala]
SASLHRRHGWRILRVPDSASALRPSGSTPAPSSLVSTVSPPAPPGSLVPPAPPWAPLLQLRLVAPSGSSFPPAPPQFSVALAPPRTSGFPPWSPEPWAMPWPSGSLVSPRIIGSLSPPRAPPPPAPPPSGSPLELSALPPPWLLPL